MLQDENELRDEDLNEEGYLKEMASWTREKAEELAVANDIGVLTDDHWRVIEFVKRYYEHYGCGPAVVKIGKATGMSADSICALFPCGVVKGAYRLAGLPRPPGCV